MSKVNLYIDSSTNFLFLGLEKRNIEIDRFVRVSNADISKYIVNDIKNLLERNGMGSDGVANIYIGIGPGSYTGIRIAVTTGKILAYFIKARLYSVSSLFFLSSGYEKICAMMDARNNNVFGAVYDNSKTILKDGFFNKGELLSKYSNFDAKFLDINTYYIDYKKIKSKAIYKKDYALLEPNYLRKTEAERNLEKRNN